MSFSAFSYGRKRTETPGPGAYSIPSNLGEGPKYSFRDRPKEKVNILEPPMLLLPSTLNGSRTSFGGRSKPQTFDETPGPKYDLRNNDFDKNLPKISIHIRTKTQETNLPSPTSYNVPSSIQPRQLTISTGKRTDLIDHQPRPSPGKYVLPSDFSTHKQISIRSHLAPKKIDNSVPGPGHYEVTRKAGKEAPKFSFPKDNLNDNTNGKRSKSSFSPGPADYYSSFNSIGGQNNKIPYSIGRKARTPANTEDNHDYPYQNIGGTIIPKNMTIGIRPEMCYETVSPGPIYDNSTNLGGKKITIGPLTKIQVEGENISPSPDYYFKAPFIVPSQKPFKGFAGPASREPDEIKRDKWIPSPTQYSIESSIDNKNNGITIGERRKDEFKNDRIDPPYGPPISTFGGPKYTIGRKTEEFVF